MICNVEMRERKLSRCAPANSGKEDRPEALRFAAHLLGIFIAAHGDALRMIKFGYVMGFRNPRELNGRTRGCTAAERHRRRCLAVARRLCQEATQSSVAVMPPSVHVTMILA
jgi:hypothetical protein